MASDADDLQLKRVRIYVIEGQVAPEVDPPSLIGDMVRNVLYMQFVAKADVYVISTQNEAAAARLIGQDIVEHGEQYAGFVVVQDHEHAIFTANILTFLFDKLPKPVVFTGIHANQPAANDPVSYARLGIETNVLTALQIATLEAEGPLMAYGPQLVRPVRAAAEEHFIGQGFRSLYEQPVGLIQFGIHLKQKKLLAIDDMQFSPDLDDRVMIVTHQPNLDLMAPPYEKTPVFIVRLADEAIPPIISRIPEDKTVLIYGTGVDPHKRRNIAFINAITLPALVAKAMVAAGKFPNNPDAVISYVMQETHNEFLPL